MGLAIKEESMSKHKKAVIMRIELPKVHNKEPNNLIAK